MKREALIKHWEAIEAFRNGKIIYSDEQRRGKFSIDTTPNFYFENEYFAVNKDQKVIQEYSEDLKIWFTEDNVPINLLVKHNRIRIEFVKPESKKRTPTIGEVKQWFLDNKLFINKNGILIRIESLNKKDEKVYFDRWYTIDEFCKQFTHYDGSELYITE